ncbi:uncharacterized protein LOC142905656 [Petromyzon marinus]|uniref:uncharacterized protein LOC142905656 n=1 Tax=Petromyzon marinus TaxID=7757 RepID=UPI003F71974E
MSRKAAKKRNVPVDSGGDSDNDDLQPGQMASSTPDGDSGSGGAEGPGSPEDWRVLMTQWEARMEKLSEEFQNFLTENRIQLPVPGPPPEVATQPEQLEDSDDEDDQLEGPPRRLHVQRFEAKVGDWTAFIRRFRAAYESLNWTESAALRALPTALDDDSLATFNGFPAAVRKTLDGAIAAMRKVYEPRSVAKRRFQQRKREATESPLAFRSALLALAQVAYPAMDEEGWDSLLQEKMLQLAKELKVVLSLPDKDDDDDVSSLLIARNIQVNLDIRDEPAAAVAQPSLKTPAGAASTVAVVVDETPLMAAAARVSTGERRRRPGAYGDGVHRTCYECGRKGHLARDCWR